jgi:HPt (histidine-containing phosphotransfer) domain-containing protein
MAVLRKEFALSGIGELVEMMKNEGPPALSRIASSIERGDANALRRAAHALRGAAANFGARPLEAICAEIENHGREGRAALAAALTAPLHAEYQRVITALENEANQAPSL